MTLPDRATGIVDALLPSIDPELINADYLAWARYMGARLAAHSGCYNLFSSAVREPLDLLMADLQAVGWPAVLERTKRTSSWGHPDLISGIQGHYGIDDPARILITSGGSMAFVLAALALVEPGEHALLESPLYQPFQTVLLRRGARVSHFTRDTVSGQPDLAMLEALIRPETRLIVLTNLHNPGGTLLDDATLQQIAAIADHTGATIVIDEVFHDLAPDGPDYSRTAALLADNIVSISSLSKAYGLGRLRVGWMIAAPPIMARLREVHVTFETSLSSLDQAAASVVFDGLPRYRQHGQETVAANRPAVLRFAAEMIAAGRLEGAVPPYGCVWFPRLCGLAESDALVEHLREHCGVAVVPGRFFGAPAYIRLGFGGDPAQVSAGLARLAEALLALPGGQPCL